MNNMRIVEIPASMRENAGRKNTVRKLRVAAYCRVSTEEEEQQGSFEIQKLYYTEKINSTPEWEVAGIYADDGISGVHTKKRDGFNQMIQDCKKRKIDLILTKSISRFARNTLDSIQYVRMLKQMGIAVVFEKENINTATMNSEMILTVLSAFAQAESESISQNVARGKRMGYKHGKFAFPYGRIIGYRKGADGKPEIIPEQAEVIRLIFNSYLQGDSLQSIKTKLETAGALTARGNTEWSAQSIQRILQNEKYCGDVLLQKTFTEDVLTGVHKKNTGQLPQYYIENYHEGIVSKQIFREVQAEIARRNSKSAANQRKRRRGRYNSKYALTERLVCGDCGSPYKRVTWNIHGRKQIVWRCVNRIEYGTKFCGSSPSIPEEKLHRAILKAVQDLAANFTDEVAAQINGILHSIQTGESIKPNLQEQLEQTQQEFDRLLEMSLDFDEDTPFLDNRLKKLNNKIKSLKKAIEESAARQEKARQPEMLLSAKDLQILEYDDALTARIIEKITVRSRNEIEIRFIGGYKKTMQLS
jgi:site-specific DNA recombinase